MDKRFKLDKPPGINLTSSNTRPIKATRTALENIKANEKSIKNSRTGKVTAVVAIMKIFSKNFNNSRNSNSKKSQFVDPLIPAMSTSTHPASWVWTDHTQISLPHSPTPPKCSTRAIGTLINNLGIVYHQYCSSSYLDHPANPGSLTALGNGNQAGA